MRESFEIGERGVARIAGWPLETLDDLRSAGLVADIRALLAAEADVARVAREVCDQLGEVVPLLADRAERAAVLSLRRALHNSVRPVAADAVRDPLLGMIPGLPSRFAEHLDRRVELAAHRDRVRAGYVVCHAREREGFRAAAKTPRFARALALAAPDLSRAWNADRRAGADDRRARARRRELSVFGYLLRAVGRPVPSGLWAGVSAVEPEDDERVGAMRAVKATPNIAVIPELGPWLEVAKALAGPDGASVEAPDDGDPWHAIEARVEAIPDGNDRARWRAAVEATRSGAARLETLLARGPAEEIAEETADELNGLGKVLGELRGASGLAPIEATAAVRVDWRLPVELRWTARDRARHARALDALARFVRVDGGPELWRRAALSSVGLQPGIQRSLDDAIRSATGAARPPRPDALTDRARAFRTFDDPAVAAEAADLAHRWERVLEPVHADARVDLRSLRALDPLDAASDSAGELRFGPAGSVLVEPSTGGAGRYLAPRPGPAVFAANHHGVADGPLRQALAWFDGWASSGVGVVEIIAADPVNPTVAVVPRVSTAAIDARSPASRADWLVHVDARQRSWLVDEAGVPHLALVPHLSLIGVSDDASAVLRTCAAAFGGEVPAAVFPMLPAERGRWHHLPELRIGDEIVVARERYVIDHTDLDVIRSIPDPFDRFVSWVAFTDGLGLPATVTARVTGSPNEPGRLVPIDSILGVETFLHDSRRLGPQLVVESGPTVDDAVTLPGSGHHVTQIAVSWRDNAYWQRCPPPWRSDDSSLPSQVNLKFDSDGDGPRIDWMLLRQHVDDWKSTGLVTRWFFVRKPPGLRMRFEARDTAAFTAAVQQWGESLPSGSLREARLALYQPERERFGGSAGLELAHDLWYDTAPVAVALELADPARRWRYPIAARACSTILQSIFDDPRDHASVWARLHEPFAAMECPPDSLTTQALTGPAGFTDRLTVALQDVAAALLAASLAAAGDIRGAIERGDITSDPRQWIADAVLFQWNAFGLGLDFRMMASMTRAGFLTRGTSPSRPI